MPLIRGTDATPRCFSNARERVDPCGKGKAELRVTHSWAAALGSGDAQRIRYTQVRLGMLSPSESILKVRGSWHGRGDCLLRGKELPEGFGSMFQLGLKKC